MFRRGKWNQSAALMWLSCACISTAHAATGESDPESASLFLFPALGTAVDFSHGRSWTFDQGLNQSRRPHDLSSMRGLCIPMYDGAPALAKEFIITISDGDEVATLTRLGKPDEFPDLLDFDFRAFDNIDRVDLSAIRHIGVDYLDPADVDSESAESPGSTPVPSPGAGIVLAAWLVRPGRRRAHAGQR